MAKQPKKTGEPALPGINTTTKPKAQGEILPVTDPIDLWYLCEKCSYAQQHPLRNKNGVAMYQRSVTRWVRKDARNFDFRFPYHGEVGFDMTQSPPRAIMSKTESWRPSMFPLSRYSEIRRGYLPLNGIDVPTEFRTEEALVSKDELERTLDPRIREGKMVRVNGMSQPLLRIPDVLRVKDVNRTGAEKYRQDNLEFVIEIKFPGDRFREGQLRAYRQIAGPKHATTLRLLDPRVCSMRRRKARDWIRTSQREPVYKPLSRVMEQVEQRRNSLAFIPEYQLLIDAIDREHEEVRRILTPAPMPADTPVIKPIYPIPSYELDRRERQFRKQMEMTLAAPFMVAGAMTFAVGATGLLAADAQIGLALGAARNAAGQAARIIPFPRVLRPIAAGSAAAAATEKLAAQVQRNRSARETEREVQVQYLYWPD
ncbi:hypothetical protein [Cupriavidus sp. 2SB]|uniref:hypothetical protein n=1 Tax=unclassified Cupriavidus TaxID=2640874 RepID=UPI0010F6E6C9|nr:hypothetical protein [Cupriavidus sp. 2SB]